MRGKLKIFTHSSPIPPPPILICSLLSLHFPISSEFTPVCPVFSLAPLVVAAFLGFPGSGGEWVSVVAVRSQACSLSPSCLAAPVLRLGVRRVSGAT